MSIAIKAPDFGGDAVGHLPDACTPRDLFRHLLNCEEDVHYFEPAYKFAVAALDRADVPSIEAGSASGAVAALLDWASAELSARPVIDNYASSWPMRVVREFAPAGLNDGAWLSGLGRANVVENEVGMKVIKQLMIRYSDPGVHESYVQRYQSLLRSIGVIPASISRWEPDDTAPCADISYEHALLGPALALFPIALRPETVGFNLWMAALGPCPLLESLTEELRGHNANLQYFDMHQGEALRDLAIQTAVLCLEEEGDVETSFLRLARGFAAAHHSYRRWEEAMLGRNVPMTPRDFVLDTIRQKAYFALGHHTRISFGKTRLEDLFRGGRAGHEAILDHLVTSGLVYPGSPEDSPFMSHSISFDGPMFEVFTASEQRDLREWIIGLKDQVEVPPQKSPVPLQGEYAPPQDPESLHRYAMAHYGRMSMIDHVYYGSNADQYPPVRVFARTMLDMFLKKLSDLFQNDPRLAGSPPPKWSERALAEMVMERHERNVRARPVNNPSPPAVVEAVPAEPGKPKKPKRPTIHIAFDGQWLQGFLDVHRSDREEYGWLFRIYASEQGDGDMAWNHNRILRLAVSAAGPEVMLPATDRAFYEFCDVPPISLMTLAASLCTRHFMPELLGGNLGVEVTGVGGSYLDSWRKFVSEDNNHWAALSFRLHNSIDNYVSGHTKWSMAAVQAFMAQVEESAPSAVESQWQRIWRVWRLQEIVEHGTEDEQRALQEAIGGDVSNLAPIPASLESLAAASA